MFHWEGLQVGTALVQTQGWTLLQRTLWKAGICKTVVAMRMGQGLGWPTNTDSAPCSPEPHLWLGGIGSGAGQPASLPTGPGPPAARSRTRPGVPDIGPEGDGPATGGQWEAKVWEGGQGLKSGCQIPGMENGFILFLGICIGKEGK